MGPSVLKFLMRIRKYLSELNCGSQTLTICSWNRRLSRGLWGRERNSVKLCFSLVGRQ